jgi:hypothetical protein
MFEMKGSNLENHVWNEMAIHEIIFAHGQTFQKKKKLSWISFEFACVLILTNVVLVLCVRLCKEFFCCILGFYRVL